METPKDYRKKINDGIVTRDMLLHVIFAFNKRAKIYKEEEKNCYLFNFAKKSLCRNKGNSRLFR